MLIVIEMLGASTSWNPKGPVQAFTRNAFYLMDTHLQLSAISNFITLKSYYFLLGVCDSCF